MKSIVFFFLLLLSIAKLNAQITYSSELDRKNGLKVFVFGYQKNMYEHLLSAKKLSNDGQAFGYGIFDPKPFDTVFYEYLGTEPNELFGVRWKKIILGFTKNQLTEIVIFWRDPVMSHYSFDNVLYGLQSVFGKTEKQPLPGDTFHYTWRGQNIYMSLSKSLQSTETTIFYKLYLRNTGLIQEIVDPKNQF